jgi:hypothetical protein
VQELIDIESICDRARAYCQEDRLLPLQGDSWYTGFSSDGRQMAIVYDEGEVTVLWFDTVGRLVNTEVVLHHLTEPPGAYFQRDEYPQLEALLRERFGYRDGAIRVRPFRDSQTGVAARSLPYWLENFVINPEGTPVQHRQEVAEWVQEWLENRDTYALEVWGNTFFIDINDGQCTSS